MWPRSHTRVSPLRAALISACAVCVASLAHAGIPGHPGTYKDIDAMTADTKTRVPKTAAANGGKGVAIGIDLIYGLEIPCKGTKNCLESFDQGTRDNLPL